MLADEAHHRDVNHTFATLDKDVQIYMNIEMILIN